MIGDVGHFRDGRFFPLFNAILGSDSDAPGSLPEGFVKLEYDRRLEATNEQYLSPIPICSSDVTTTEAGAGVTVYVCRTAYCEFEAHHVTEKVFLATIHSNARARRAQFSFLAIMPRTISCIRIRRLRSTCRTTTRRG